MRDYSKVSSSFWTGKTGKSLRGNHQAQVVALYLMTCPHANMIGVFHCPIIYIAHETGSTIEGATKGLDDLIKGAFCTYDEDSEVVWVHEMARFQIGENLSPNDKQVIGIKKQFEHLPEGLIKQGFYARYKDDFILPKFQLFAINTPSPLEAPSKPEAGTEPVSENKTALSDKSDGAKSLALQILDHLNLKASRKFKNVKANIRIIEARLKEFSFDELISMIDDRCIAWASDEKMHEYLRPETLFNATKCAGYVGSLGASPVAGGGVPWFLTATGIEQKAEELKLTKGKDEVFPDFKNRVYKAAGLTPEAYRKAKQDYGGKAA